MQTLWLIWAPNAGKSTLFNRLIWSYRAIITDIPGTTRDLLRHKLEREGFGVIEVIDSPWLDTADAELPYINRIINDSDLLIMVVDKEFWLTTTDHNILQLVRKANKIQKLILFVNKIDDRLDENQSALVLSEYQKLGLPYITLGSAQHGRLGELDDFFEQLLIPQSENKEEIFVDSETNDDELVYDDLVSYHHDEGIIPIAILGRPNVGKSTFINTIAKTELSKVSDIPGTTLDYIIHDVVINDQQYTLYDTAGIRRRGSNHGLERIAFEKTLGMLRYYQPVILFLMDWAEGVTKTDRNLMGHLNALHLPTLVIINKLDLLDSTQKETLLTAIHEYFWHHDRLFTLWISAKTWKWIKQIRPKVHDLRTRSHQTLSTGKLNRIISHQFLEKPPTFPRNRAVKVYYTTQVKTYPPSFMAFINNKKHLTQSFKNRLETTIRQWWNYKWIPLNILYRDKKMQDKAWYEKHLQKRKKAIKRKLRRTHAERVADRQARNERNKNR